MMQEKEYLDQARLWGGRDSILDETKLILGEASIDERVDPGGLNLTSGMMGSPEMGSQQLRLSRQRYSDLTLWSLVSCASREVSVDV